MKLVKLTLHTSIFSKILGLTMKTWKKFPLRDFPRIYIKDLKSIENSINDIQNDFELKYKKDLDTDYECEYLVYYQEDSIQEGKNKPRYLYHYGEYADGEPTLPDEINSRYEEIRNNSSDNFLKIFNNNSDKGGEIIMSASEEVIKQYNNSFTASDLHSDANGLRDCNIDSITIAIQNINSKIVELGKANAQTPSPTFQEDKSKLDLVLKYSEYIQTTHRLKAKAKSYTIKSFEKWFWDIAKDNTETKKQRKLVVAELSKLKTAYEQSAPFLKGKIDFYSVLSQAIKDKKKEDGDDKPGKKDERVVCNEKMWNTFLGFASNRELRIGNEIIRTDGSDIGLTKNAAVREFISKKHKEKDYRQQIELAAKRAG